MFSKQLFEDFQFIEKGVSIQIWNYNFKASSFYIPQMFCELYNLILFLEPSLLQMGGCPEVPGCSTQQFNACFPAYGHARLLLEDCFSEFFLPGFSFYQRVEPLELFICCI